MTQKDELTPKQALAVFNFCNPQSPTFGNKGDAYLAAGYAKTKSYIQAACNLFALPKVKEAVELCRSNFEKKLEQSAEISREYALAQLQKVYTSCFEEGRCIDRTNAVATVRLMMQKNALLSDRHNVEFGFRGYEPTESGAAYARQRQAEYLKRKAAESISEPLMFDQTGSEGVHPGGGGGRAGGL